MGAFLLNCAIAVGALLLYLGCQFLLSFCMTLVSQIAYMIQNPMATYDEVYAFCDEFILAHQCFALLFSALFTFLLLWAYFKARNLSPIEELHAPKRKFFHILLFMFFGTALSYAIGFLVAIIPWPETWLSVYEAESSELMQGEGIVLQFLTLVISGPILEEVIFRGMMQSYLEKSMPAVLAAAIQCIIFGLVHGTPLWMCYTFVFGVILTICNKKTGSLWTSIAMHIGFNLVALLP